MILRNQKNQTDDESHYDDGPSEWVSRQKRQKCYKEIVDRLVYECWEECTKKSRFWQSKKYTSVSKWCFYGSAIFAWFGCKNLVKFFEWKYCRRAWCDGEWLAKTWYWFTHPNERDRINSHRHITTWIYDKCTCREILELYGWNIGYSDRIIFYTQYCSLRCIHRIFLWEKKILYSKRQKKCQDKEVEKFEFVHKRKECVRNLFTVFAYFPYKEYNIFFEFFNFRLVFEIKNSSFFWHKDNVIWESWD